MALPDDIEAATQELQQRFPGWSVWRSDIGRWWALRNDGNIPPGARANLDADSAHDLEATLIDEERARTARTSSPLRRTPLPWRTTDDPSGLRTGDAP
ncbi:hypothetical protein [Nonomuraea wenchangensis]|uniref:Uncharacterized protein n=1 Tax=Nonomuraea wenchangensis TaxID=568860 RepID=A0A1I0EN78_9ACTN|nr:hypothetical protein [Nonomuraea wenchangensis]SET46930.1 hypothetical protein SAMN05421811_103136 [Nonomuraea wenchangensis]